MRRTRLEPGSSGYGGGNTGSSGYGGGNTGSSGYGSASSSASRPAPAIYKPYGPASINKNANSGQRFGVGVAIGSNSGSAPSSGYSTQRSVYGPGSLTSQAQSAPSIFGGNGVRQRNSGAANRQGGYGTGRTPRTGYGTGSSAGKHTGTGSGFRIIPSRVLSSNAGSGEKRRRCICYDL
ncbi:PREDICTED: ATP-dependent RNA helicase glh-2-like [Priapulus caudatus]|uniref:ATP-dependent RNA helicase glh-2-like n=1 Tax=Priapulus caudatus TaxID=37621 RepID=A0ABM1EPK5_PRICU|nr:PREDICTED: ATP-dependent RNA helicase glh-2-like [Priapulus caudatus]